VNIRIWKAEYSDCWLMLDLNWICWTGSI